MAHKSTRRLAEITNTPRARKAAVPDVEHATIVPDSEILSLHLDVSSDEEVEGVEYPLRTAHCGDATDSPTDAHHKSM